MAYRAYINMCILIYKCSYNVIYAIQKKGEIVKRNQKQKTLRVFANVTANMPKDNILESNTQ